MLIVPNFGFQVQNWCDWVNILVFKLKFYVVMSKFWLFKFKIGFSGHIFQFLGKKLVKIHVNSSKFWFLSSKLMWLGQHFGF